MYKRTTVIANPTGLHARPASDFIALAGKYTSRIIIKRINGDEDEEANAKSIVGLLSLGLCQGEEVEITAKGEDEAQAVDALIALIDSRFGE